MRLSASSAWTYQPSDPNDEVFSQIVEGISLSDLSDTKVVLCGEPYDGAVISRKGAAKGPEAIRNQLAKTKTHHFDIGSLDSIGDIGNIDTESSTVRETQQEIADVTNELHASSAFPILVGGDNSVTVGNVEPLLSRRSVGVISLDAHLDCREVQDQPSSGTPYRQLFESGLDSLVVLGARHFETSTTYHDYLQSQNGEIITAEEIGEDVVSSADQAIDALDDVDCVYISLDMDVLDMSAAPGVSAPTPGGILSRELFRLLRLLSAESRICGFEVVECAPPLDTGTKTVTTAARAIAHFISGYQINR